MVANVQKFALPNSSILYNDEKIIFIVQNHLDITIMVIDAESAPEASRAIPARVHHQPSELAGLLNDI
jgi:hypothetical protein